MSDAESTASRVGGATSNAMRVAASSSSTPAVVK